MNSAFGIDHGYDEVSKMGIPGFSQIGSKIAGLTAGAGRKLTSSGMANRAGGFAGGGSMGRAQHTAGRLQGSAGGALKKLSGGMAKRPGLTGGLAVGGGAAGVGAGAGALGNRKRY